MLADNRRIQPFSVYFFNAFWVLRRMAEMDSRGSSSMIGRMARAIPNGRSLESETEVHSTNTPPSASSNRQKLSRCQTNPFPSPGGNCFSLADPAWSTSLTLVDRETLSHFVGATCL